MSLSKLTAALQGLADAVTSAVNDLLRIDPKGPDTFSAPTAYVLPDVAEQEVTPLTGDKVRAKVDRKRLTIPKLNKKGTGRKAADGRLLLPIPASFLLSLPADPDSRAVAFVAAIVDAILTATCTGDTLKSRRSALCVAKPAKGSGAAFVFPAGLDVPKAWSLSFKLAAAVVAPEAFLLSLKLEAEPTRLMLECSSNASAESKKEKCYSSTVPLRYAHAHLPGGPAAECFICGRPFALFVKKGVLYIPPPVEVKAETLEHYPNPDEVHTVVTPEAAADAVADQLAALETRKSRALREAV